MKSMRREQVIREIVVAIVEDHEDLRNGLSLIFRTTPGYKLVGSYSSCEELFEETELHATEVVLMDIGLLGMSGIEGVRTLKARHPEIQAIMLTIYEDDMRVFEAICAGADGYLLKKSSPVEILHAIDQVREGGVPMTPCIAQRVLKAFREVAPRPSAGNDLTSREFEILRSLVDGLDYKQIADRHFISIDTVRGHIRHIYEKLKVHSKSAAVSKALRDHLV
jgi:DNA-binding NarL/FixJ family response regulator